MSTIRKAIAAFLTPFLGLPLIDWVTGSPVDDNLLRNAVGAAIVAVVVYFVPNAALGITPAPYDPSTPPGIS